MFMFRYMCLQEPPGQVGGLRQTERCGRERRAEIVWLCEKCHDENAQMFEDEEKKELVRWMAMSYNSLDFHMYPRNTYRTTERFCCFRPL